MKTRLMISDSSPNNGQNRGATQEGRKRVTFEKREERGTTDRGFKETCWNCRHKANGDICPDHIDPRSEDNWCPRYEPQRGQLICADCMKCTSPKDEGECPLVIKDKVEEKRLIKKVNNEDIEVEWK